MMSCVLTSLIIAYFIIAVAARLSPGSILGKLGYLMERLLGWLTFPGVILHEASRKLFCDLAGIPVHEAKYFSFGDPAGYVLHDKVTRYRDSYLLTIGPFIVNTVFAMAMFILPCFNMPFIVDIIFLWLGVSFAVRAMPGDAEAQSLWRWSERKSPQNPLVFLGYPPVIITSFVKPLKKALRMNLIYAVALYSVTFCLMAAILFAGSMAIPGAYSVKVVSADAGSVGNRTPVPITGGYVGHILSQYNASSYSGSNARGPIDGKEGTAKDWLPVADAAIKNIDSNATLVYVHGYSKDAGATLPVNGKCHRWWYEYLLPDNSTAYDVYVQDGTLKSVSKNKLGPRSRAGILSNDGAWTMDSVDAVAIANGAIVNVTGGKVPGSAAYVLEKNGPPINTGKPTWHVCYYDADGKVITTIMIDHDTGNIVDT